MSDISTPEPEPPKPKKQLLDNFFVKFLFSLVAWLAPLPVAVVLLKLWFTEGAPPEQLGTDPFQSIRHTITAFSGSVADLILLVSLLPSVLLLSILYRTAARRTFAIAALAILAVGELVLFLEISPGPG